MAGAPGLSLKPAGPDQVKISVDLGVLSASAVAQLERTGPDTFRVHLVSTDGIPPSLLGSLQDFTVRIPKLPLGLTIQSVKVSRQGVLIHVTGTNVPFGQ